MKWKQVKFSDLFEFQPKSSIKAGDGLTCGKYPFFTSSSTQSKFLNNYTFDNEALIFGSGGNASLHYCKKRFSTSTDCFVVLKKDDELVDMRYSFYYLSGNIHILEAGFKGAGLKHISKDYINNISIPLPPLSVQLEIAEVLDRADTLQQKDQLLLQKYDDLAQSIFYDMFGDPVKNEKGWAVKSLGKLIYPGEKISYGIVQPGDEQSEGPRVIRVGDFENLGINQRGLKRVSSSIESNYKKTRLIGDEILIACVGSVGKIALVDSSLAGCNIVRATARVRVNPLIINRYYLASLLATPSVQAYFIKETRTVSQPTLNISHIEETEIINPPKNLQENYSTIFKNIQRQKISAVKGDSELLFKSLLVKSFND